MIKPGFISARSADQVDIDELFAEMVWADGGSVVDELFAEFAREE